MALCTGLVKNAMDAFNFATKAVRCALLAEQYSILVQLKENRLFVYLLLKSSPDSLCIPQGGSRLSSACCCALNMHVVCAIFVCLAPQLYKLLDILTHSLATRPQHCGYSACNLRNILLCAGCHKYASIHQTYCVYAAIAGLADKLG